MGWFNSPPKNPDDITLTVHEISLLLNIVAKDADPNNYRDDNVKSLIYKAKGFRGTGAHWELNT